MASLLDELLVKITFREDIAGIERAEQRIKAMRGNLDTWAKNITKAGLALTGFAAGIGAVVLPFERSMNTLRAVFGDAADDASIAALRQQALDLGETTSKTATDAANAQVALARAGFSTAETLAVTNSVLNAAIAGELEMGEAASVVGNAIRAFGLEAEDAARVVDVLATAANSSNSTISEMGSSFRQVAPIAAQLGVEIETVSAMIGSLRNQGFIAQQAGTALRGMFSRLIGEPSDRARQQMQELGIAFEEVQRLALQGDILGSLGMLRTDDPARAAQLYVELFGQEMFSAAGAVINNLEWISTQAAVATEGAAERMREEVEKGLPGALADMRSAIEGMFHGIGSAGFTSLAEDIIRGITSIIRWLNRVTPTPLLAIAGAAAVIGPILLGIAAALKTVSIVLGIYMGLIKGLLTLKKAWAASTLVLRVQLAALTALQWARVAATKAATAAQWLLNIALNANPLGLVVLAVGAAIAAYVLLKDKLDDIWQWLKDNAALMGAALATAFLGPLPLAVYLIAKYKDEILGFIQEIIDAVMGIPLIGDVIRGVGDAVDAVGGFLGIGGDDPTAPAPAAAVTAGGASRTEVTATTNVGIEEVNISVPGGDAEDVAAAARESLEAELQGVEFAFSSGVAR